MRQALDALAIEGLELGQLILAITGRATGSGVIGHGVID
jgi:hypothetical protein